jgi:hypothetical protein
VNFPTEYRIDAELPCDVYGNLRGYPINVFPTNDQVEARRDGAPLPEKTSTPLPRTSC